jgi:hypothetical protein
LVLRWRHAAFALVMPELWIKMLKALWSLGLVMEQNFWVNF